MGSEREAAGLIRSGRTGSRPWVDIVLPPEFTSWNIRGGWIAAARRTVHLNRVFPVLDRKGEELFRYLKRPEADLILLLGFDTHLDFLHLEDRWKERWRSAGIFKVSLSHEGVFKGSIPRSEKKAASALACVDLAVFNDPFDGPFFAGFPVPSRWQPGGVDESVFRRRTAFSRRSPRPFFQGREEPFFGLPGTLQRRRELLDALRARDLVDTGKYDPGSPVESLSREFDRRRIVLNLPSIFRGFTGRVFEGLSCGCAVVTPSPAAPCEREMFSHRRHLSFYDPGSPQDLVGKLEELMADPASTQRMAEEGWGEVMGKHTLARRWEEIVGWAGEFGGAGAAGGKHGPSPVPGGKDLPAHFLTVVGDDPGDLGAHVDVFRELPFSWTWHLVWGGQAPEPGCVAGVADRCPGRIRIHRPPRGRAWEDASEMLNAPLGELPDGCLLWRIDPDEIWLPEQIQALRSVFQRVPGKRCASFSPCTVPEERTPQPLRYDPNEANSYDLQRVFRFRAGDRWKSSINPRLCSFLRGVSWRWRSVESLSVAKLREADPRELLFWVHATDPEGMRDHRRACLILARGGRIEEYLPPLPGARGR